MSNASISSYSLQSTLPKDVSGFKFLGWVRSDASVAPFTLPKGIGTSPNGSGYMFSSLAVGSHSQGSKIEANHVGMALMGLFLQDGNMSGSKVESGQAQLIQSTRKGELIVSGACKIPVADFTSANIYTLGSGLLHGGYISGAGVTAGDTVFIRSGENTMLNLVFDAANQTFPLQIPAGGVYFSGSITHTRSISGGATSITLFVERP